VTRRVFWVAFGFAVFVLSQWALAQAPAPPATQLGSPPLGLADLLIVPVIVGLVLVASLVVSFHKPIEDGDRS